MLRGTDFSKTDLRTVENLQDKYGFYGTDSATV